jgi:hypothetical protein
MTYQNIIVGISKYFSQYMYSIYTTYTYYFISISIEVEPDQLAQMPNQVFQPLFMDLAVEELEGSGRLSRGTDSDW